MRGRTTGASGGALLVALAWALGCGGASLGGNQAGGDGWLDHASAPTSEIPELADDGRCAWTGRPFVSVSAERAFAMLYETEQGDCAELVDPESAEHKTIWGLKPGEQVPELLIDVSGHEDVRLLDTSEGLLLMGEVAGVEHLYRVDAEELSLLSERTTESWYWGTRTSPSRRWVAVGDNRDSARLPLHVVDPRTLQSAELDPGGVWAEAMWLTEREALAAILFDETYVGARLALWDLTGRDSLPTLTDQTLTLPPPVLDLRVEGVSPVWGFGFTWIGVDPLDRYVVFPVQSADVYEQQLVVLDVRDGSVRVTGPARGPVAFTPDGGAIVAWDMEQQQQLIVIDPVTLASETVPLPMEGVPTYFVSPEGNTVLVADVYGQDKLVIVDVATGQQITLDEALPLHTFTNRQGHDEVWLVDDGLWRVDLADALVEEVPLAWRPRSVVWMPQADLLYLDDLQQPRMIFWDPEARASVTEVSLVGNLRARPRLSLAR